MKLSIFSALVTLSAFLSTSQALSPHLAHNIPYFPPSSYYAPQVIESHQGRPLPFILRKRLLALSLADVSGMNTPPLALQHSGDDLAANDAYEMLSFLRKNRVVSDESGEKRRIGRRSWDYDTDVEELVDDNEVFDEFEELDELDALDPSSRMKRDTTSQEQEQDRAEELKKRQHERELLNILVNPRRRAKGFR